LTFNPADFYSLSQWLVGTRTDESALRTAIGRAYYTVHLSAVEKAKVSRGYQPKGAGDEHGAIIRHLKVGRTTSLANQIEFLRMLREHADYHVTFDSTIVPRQCDLCAKATKASAPAPSVTIADWNNACAITSNCITLIAKL